MIICVTIFFFKISTSFKIILLPFECFISYHENSLKFFYTGLHLFMVSFVIIRFLPLSFEDESSDNNIFLRMWKYVKTSTTFKKLINNDGLRILCHNKVSLLFNLIRLYSPVIVIYQFSPLRKCVRQ